MSPDEFMACSLLAQKLHQWHQSEFHPIRILPRACASSVTTLSSAQLNERLTRAVSKSRHYIQSLNAIGDSHQPQR